MKKLHPIDSSCLQDHKTTATKTSCSTLSTPQIEWLKALASALFYLAKQAETKDLTSINFFLREGIQKIDHLLCNHPEDTLPRLIDESLYDSMHFLYNLNELPDNKRSDFNDFFESLRNICQTRRREKPTHSKKVLTSPA